MRRGNRGFTLMEAAMTGVLVAIGVAGTLSGIGSMSRAQSRIQEQDRMQRLAHSKLDELVATGTAGIETNGNFSEYGDDRYEWRTEVGTTSVQNLNTLRVTVAATDARTPIEVSVQGLVYVPSIPVPAAGP